LSTQETKLAAIADAIRTKEGSSARIPANDFASRILALETGGLPDNVYTIDVQASDPEGGTVSGGGVASSGMTVTVAAAPADTHQFDGWTEGGATVSKEKQYTFQVSGNRALVAGFEVKASRLPEGYTEVEYIQTNHYCNILTNLSVNFKKTRMVIDIEPDEYNASVLGWNAESIFACPYLSISGKTYTFYLQRYYKKVQYRFGTDSISDIDQDISNTRFLIEYNGEEGILSLGESKYPIFNQDISMQKNLFLFASTNGYSIACKLFSAKVYYNGMIQRDFIPCTNEGGKAGLYDAVEGTFYQNYGGMLTGEGVITPGPAI